MARIAAQRVSALSKLDFYDIEQLIRKTTYDTFGCSLTVVFRRADVLALHKPADLASITSSFT